MRRRFTGLVEAETERLIDAIEPDGRAELRRGLAGPLAATVVMQALGLEGTETARIRAWYEAFVEAVTGVAAGDPVTPAGREAFALRASVEPRLARDPARRCSPPLPAGPAASRAPRSSRTPRCLCSAGSRRPRG